MKFCDWLYMSLRGRKIYVEYHSNIAKKELLEQMKGMRKKYYHVHRNYLKMS